MLDLFKGDQEEKMIDLVEGLNAALAEFGGGGLVTDLGENVDIVDEEGVSTQTVERSIKEGYLINFPELFSTQNAVTMRDNVLAGGRRVETYREDAVQAYREGRDEEEQQAQLQAKVDSSIDIINLKDTVNL